MENEAIRQRLRRNEDWICKIKRNTHFILLVWCDIPCEIEIWYVEVWLVLDPVIWWHHIHVKICRVKRRNVDILCFHPWAKLDDDFSKLIDALDFSWYYILIYNLLLLLFLNLNLRFVLLRLFFFRKL
jgi:hypothetical protein